MTLIDREQTDEQFLAKCRWEAFRGPGPGGQKRNKTSSAVRITHEPSGASATAAESRSQAENRARALKRLRLQLVLDHREAIDVATFARPEWLSELMPDGRLDLSRRHERYLPVIGLVLDILAAVGWSVSDAARLLGVSTANLVRFLRDEEKIWAKVNQMRTSIGLRPLNS